MRFIGQDHIKPILRIILPDLYLNSEKGENILLRGPSGYGKTKMALEICTYLANNNFQVFLGDLTEFHFRKRVIFIDEIHKVKDIESFYHIMDEKEHVLVFATNSDGILPEAFVNRCIHLIFQEYSDENLLLMCYLYSRFRANENSFMKIIRAGNRNPRIIKEICEIFSLHFEQNPGINPEEQDFDSLLSNIFSIEGGLNVLCRRYLSILSDIGGTSSIQMLSSLLHIDSQTLVQEVEPILLRRNLIKITSKGRSLINV